MIVNTRHKTRRPAPAGGWWIVPALTISALLWLVLGLVVWEAVQ